MPDLSAIRMERIKRNLSSERERLEGSLIEFYKAAWPEFDPARYVHGRHLEAIAEHLEAVSYGKIRKLVINVPPRHSKSLLTSVAWPAWTWARMAAEGFPLIGPQVKFLCLSYSGQLAIDHATICHRLVISEWYQAIWGSRVQIAADQDAKTKFDTTAGGSRISSSFGGTVTGRGGDIKILDDPHNMGEVESETMRESVIKRYDGALKSRFTDPKHSAEVLIAQRGHEDDLSAHFLDDPETVHLNLPAEYDGHFHCSNSFGWEDWRKDDGELLWPERFGKKELAQFKTNPFEWSSQWQQNPTPRGGSIIKDRWWELWDATVARRYGREWNEEPGKLKEFPPFDLVVASLDTAYSEKQEADYSALTIWGAWRDLNKNRKFMLAYAWNERLEFHDLVKKVMATCKTYKVDRLLIENKAAGISIGQEIRRLAGRESYGVQLIDPKRLDKIARAHSIVHLFAEGMVWAPETEWARMVIQQCASLRAGGGGSHDDLADTVTQALSWLRTNGIAERNEEASALMADMMTYRKPQAPIYDA